MIAGVAAVSLGGGVASAELERLGGLELRVNAGFKPKKLPRKRFAPISLSTGFHMSAIDGSVPPGLTSAVLDFDRHGKVRPRGLPSCSTAQLEGTTTEDARAVCNGARVGEGSARFLVDPPDAPPFGAPGPVLAFNGERQGRNPTVVFHVRANLPEPTTVVIPAPISKAPGPIFGRRVRFEVPRVAGGTGLLTDFEVTIQRRFRHRGKRRSYVVARCKAGDLLVRGDLRFSDGGRAFGSLGRDCRVKRAKRRRGR